MLLSFYVTLSLDVLLNYLLALMFYPAPYILPLLLLSNNLLLEKEQCIRIR